jgi:hypothetical protein
MKQFKSVLAALVFVSLIVFASCDGGGSGTKEDPAAEQAKKLVATWTVSNVTDPASAPQAQWTGLTLTVNGTKDGGSYTTNSNTLTRDNATSVWPTSGTWAFDGTNIGDVVRSDGVTAEIFSLTTTGLTLKFTLEGFASRTTGINGNWTFVFTKTS